MDIVRKFALLLEKISKNNIRLIFMQVPLHKSPKTLSNVFARLKQPAPSVLIREKLLLETKRYLHYTEKIS